MKIIVTGTAGFIGNAVARALLERGDEVIGIDNVNDYYSVALKRARLELLRPHNAYVHHELDLADMDRVVSLVAEARPDGIIHLAAQAGVRYSLENPAAYTRSNVDGFLSVLEACRHYEVRHLVYASSSSVYGSNTRMPFSTSDAVDHPVSLYAATKKANEMMAHSYAHIHRIPVTGLRFFTVYGPWGRPDMSPMIFSERICAGEAIDVFNHGRHRRDFTYIDDIVDGVVRVFDAPAEAAPDWDPDAPDPSRSDAPYRIFNIGNGEPVELMYFISLLQERLGRKAKLNMLPKQPGDVEATWADVSDLERSVGYRPRVGIEEGVARFVDWFLDHRGR